MQHTVAVQCPSTTMDISLRSSEPREGVSAREENKSDAGTFCKKKSFRVLKGNLNRVNEVARSCTVRGK